MRKIAALLVFLAGSFAALAQTKGHITGSVKDGSEKTVSGATISLVKATDSSVVKYGVADRNGLFSFSEIPAGAYLVMITSVGHQKAFSEPFVVSETNTAISLKSIQLEPVSKSLTGIVITAKKPFIEQKIDRMVINVDASVTNAGATALDVLEKSPGVTVDKDGNISLKGKQSVLVMMDGRPTYISGADLVNYLKGLPASAIDQIEIMTNPSAKYDAAGNSGIINIKAKKNKQVGFNGSVTLNYGQGRYAKSNNSINLNYRVGKVNLFANGSVNRGNSFQRLDIRRKFRDSATKAVEAIFEQSSHMRNQNLFTSLKIGADYFLTKKTTLGVVTSGFINPEKFWSRNTSYLQDAFGAVDSIVYAQSRNDKKWQNGSVNLNMRHQFDSTGREITMDLDYITYGSSNTQQFSNDTYNPNWTLRENETLRGDLPVGVSIYSGKIDYAQPLKKWGGKLEAGLKTSFVTTENEANYYTISGGGEVIDYSKTNHFLYEEQINAAYVSLNRQYKKLGMQLGLRYENTAYKGKQHGNPTQPDSSFKKNYSSLFPTAFLSYAVNESNQLGLSFGRRIDRPDYQDLNPFLFFIDKFTYEAGNPFLKPQFTNNFEFTHTYKGKLTTTLNYSETKDYQNETFEQGKQVNGSKNYATIVREGNIGSRKNAGVAVSAQLPVRKWWTAILYSNYNYSKFTGRLNGNGEYIDVEASNLMFHMNNQLKFDKGWSGEISGFYRTKGLDGQILIKSMGQLSAGVAKQVLKGKGTIKLNVRDIFYTQYARGEINFGNTEAYFENSRDSRVANLSFTLRFGKPIKGAQPRRKVGGADDEQNRVKVGGN